MGKPSTFFDLDPKVCARAVKMVNIVIIKGAALPDAGQMIRKLDLEPIEMQITDGMVEILAGQTELEYFAFFVAMNMIGISPEHLKANNGGISPLMRFAKTAILGK